MNLIERISDIARSHFESARSSHRWDHTQRVYRMALHLSELEGADREIVALAALLHDIGRTEEDRSRGRIRHAERGADMARKILAGESLENDKIEKIVHCIVTHRFRDNKQPETPEAKVLFDADKLDSIGAVGIARAFLFAGEVGAMLHDKEVDPEKSLPYSEEDTAYREYLVKLRYIKDQMLTRSGLELAKERHRFMTDFFERLNREVDGEI
ncbi:MAG: HD domain-containing protein [Bacteroidales bacterium]|nr:HD domain-containing protein [Bacteroidales bacterium]